ncbi:hypothetical protein [Burkholderia sp. WAC0059]|nr:hypothetical protein [Burkholderia sp. WAC0059]
MLVLHVSGGLSVFGWQQLLQLWELIVMVCRFLWDLLRLAGGGG